MTLGTLLTLFVVPTVYSLVGRTHARAGAGIESERPQPAE